MIYGPSNVKYRLCFAFNHFDVARSLFMWMVFCMAQGNRERSGIISDFIYAYFKVFNISL